MSLSHNNMLRINEVIERLATHFQPNNQRNSSEFYNLCLSLSRGIDYVIANGETPPPKARELPLLIKQMHERKIDDEPLSLAGVMVLVIAVKNACQFGWFDKNATEQVLTIVDEIQKIYCTIGNVVAEINDSSHSSVLLTTIMEKFCPNMKLDAIIASNKVEPGYGASMVDFCITKKNFQSDKNICLLVAQTDNVETSACLISPPEVNFLVNGELIDTRTMPQMPTCLTSKLKFGTNLVQAIGQFNGHYIIAIAYMSYNVATTLRHENLPYYVQPEVEHSNSQSDRNLCPAQRMRGSLSTHQLTDEVRKHLIMPSSQQDPESHLQQISNHINQGGSQANAVEVVENIQQTRVMASSHVAKQREQRRPPIHVTSRTGELSSSRLDQNSRPSPRMRGSLSAKQLTDEVKQHFIMPSSHQDHRN